jgi:Uma2 family endonuclease
MPEAKQGLKLGLRTVDLPHSIRVYPVTEEMFDEMTDEDTKAELIDGVMIVHSPASARHDDIGGFLRSLARFYAEDREAGRVYGPDSLVHLATCRRVAPDLFFLRQGRVPSPLPEEFEGAPDWVVEVLSPSNRDEDLEDKRPAYREAGVRELWFIDPEEEQVVVDRRRGKRYATTTITTGRVTSTALPGFWIESAWLWDDPLPNVVTCLREILG